MKSKYEIKLRIKTKYLRKFTNSLGAIFLFIIGIVIFFGFIIGGVYFILDFFNAFTSRSVRETLPPINYWLLLWSFPIIALFMTFDIMGKLYEITDWCWTKAGELNNKKYK